MKKFLLLTALLLTAGLGMQAAAGDWQKKAMPSKANSEVLTRADDASNNNSLIFGYCQGYEYGVGQAGTLKAAIEVPASAATQYKGAMLTKVRIGFGQANKNNITVYLSSTLNGKAFYEQPATITQQNGWNEITLETPYEITGEGFFIGYEYRNCGQGEYPIGFDDKVTNETLGDNIYVSSAGWDHVGFMFGNLSLQGVIEGDVLPKNQAAITDISVPFSIKPNTEFSITTTFANQGVKPITDVNCTVSVNGKEMENAKVTMSTSTVESGAYGQLKINGLSCDTEISDAEITVSIPEVNGEENESEITSSSAYTACFTQGVQRKMVVEEWTGTWCGWCVRGIVAMEYMKEKYGDENFIGIAVHSDDRMETNTYADFLNKYAVIGFPGSAINRSETTDPNTADLERIYNEIAKTQSYAEVTDLTANYVEVGDQLNVNAEVKFVVPVENGDYSLAFVITEDHVGPYQQYNYYAGGAYGPMDGWEKYGMQQYWYFNEVARSITKCNGIEGSIPANVAAKTPVEYNTTLSLKGVIELENSHLVALLLNGRTGEIINAKQIYLDLTGVESAEISDNLTITAERGAIVVNGEYATCDVYALDGTKVATVNGRAEVASGIYIVKATDINGNVITKKLVVR